MSKCGPKPPSPTYFSSAEAKAKYLRWQMCNSGAPQDPRMGSKPKKKPVVPAGDTVRSSYSGGKR